MNIFKKPKTKKRRNKAILEWKKIQYKLHLNMNSGLSMQVQVLLQLLENLMVGIKTVLILKKMEIDGQEELNCL
jgi:hypothetical protein